MSATASPPPEAPFPFRLRDAHRAGLTSGQTRSKRHSQRVSHGLFVLGTAPLDLRGLATATALVLPRASGFGHLTSAALRGWWLPNRVVVPQLLFASTTSGVHVQRDGVYVRRSDYATVETVGGLPLVSVPETLLELARDLSVVDLVPMVDRALAGGADAEEILTAARPRSAGARTLRRAVTLADGRSESWWESVLRLLHVTTGLGPVECQVDVRDGDAFVGRADLHLVGTDRYPECDGGEHRDKARHARDLRRDKAMHRQGCERYGYTTSEIAYQPGMIIADGERARGLPPDPARLRCWWALARGSSLTGHGRARLLARLDRYRRAADRGPRR